jgi:hypothetical protein
MVRVIPRTTSSELITAGCCGGCCGFGVPLASTTAKNKKKWFLGRSDGLRWWQDSGNMVLGVGERLLELRLLLLDDSFSRRV